MKYKLRKKLYDYRTGVIGEPVENAIFIGDRYEKDGKCIEDGKYTQPVSLSEKQFSKYECIYLFEVHGLFTETFISAIEGEHTLAEKRPEFAPPAPKESFLKKP